MHQKLDEARAVQSIQQKETDLYFPVSYEQQKKKTLHLFLASNCQNITLSLTDIITYVPSMTP